MEASEKVIDVYLKTELKAFTINNIKLKYNKEIDFLAIDYKFKRYHIESSISTSNIFSKLTNKLLDATTEKAHRRRCLEYFEKEKFNHPFVTEKLKEFNFKNNNYKKVIVTWSVKEQAVIQEAKSKGIEIWFFKEILKKVFKNTNINQYLSDEQRIFQLIGKWLKEEKLVKPYFWEYINE